MRSVYPNKLHVGNANIFKRYANVWSELVICYKRTVGKYTAAGDNAIHLFAADESYFFALWRKDESSSGAGYMIEPSLQYGRQAEVSHR